VSVLDSEAPGIHASRSRPLGERRRAQRDEMTTEEYAAALEVARRASNEGRAAIRRAPGTLSLVCECAFAGCSEWIELRPEEYGRLRADPTHFIVAAGHMDRSVERLVERRPPFSIVEKRTPRGREIAEETDPRRRRRFVRDPVWARLSRDGTRREIGARVVEASEGETLRLAVEGGDTIDVPLPTSFHTVPPVGTPVLAYLGEAGEVLGWYLPDERRGVDLRQEGRSWPS
jgi:hypothetical protein